ncbi:histidine kinase [Paenibacillus sp. P26]|nr:histidine kinase [Paenibacillus sp. P26]
MELKMQEMQRISHTIVFDPQMEQMIRELNSSGNSDAFRSYFEKKQIKEWINQIKMDAPYITGLYIFDLNGNPSYFRFHTPSINDLDASFYQKVLPKLSSSIGELVWSRFPLPSMVEPDGIRQSIIAARWMKDSSLNTYGMLVIVLDESFFSSSLEGLTRDGSGKVYLFNSSKDLLYGNASPKSEEELLPLKALNRSQIMGRDLFVQSESKAFQFSLVSGTSMDAIRSKNKTVLQVILYSGLISVIVMSVLIVLASRRLLRPLDDLVAGLQKVRSGKFDTRLRIKSKDELAYIGESFNEMTEKVEHLVNEVYLTQLSEKKAELKALQAQLNPHFLHNLFNELYWKLYLQNDKDTASPLAAVSEMLKYSLMPPDRPTTLGDELGQIRNYVKIQTELFETELETVFEVDPEAEDGEILRSLLQPLVENVFVHAFRNRISHKILMIKAGRQEDLLEIEIADNGCGMSEERVSKILGSSGTSQLQRNDGRDSLGVSSVIRRIKLMYGAPYRLEMDSELNAGTTMRLILPFRNVEKKGLEVC